MSLLELPVVARAACIIIGGFCVGCWCCLLVAPGNDDGSSTTPLLLLEFLSWVKWKENKNVGCVIDDLLTYSITEESTVLLKRITFCVWIPERILRSMAQEHLLVGY